jgi:hypothetical protein
MRVLRLALAMFIFGSALTLDFGALTHNGTASIGRAEARRHHKRRRHHRRHHRKRRRHSNEL